MINIRRISLLALTSAATLLAGLGAPLSHATDIEVFFSSPDPNTAKPNILFIVDTSTSMFTPESTAVDPYVSTKIYPGACVSGNYYWTTSGAPVCGAAGWAGLTPAQFQCATWKAAVNTSGVVTRSTRVAQNSAGTWVNNSAHPAQVARDTSCEGDSAVPSINWSKKVSGKFVYTSAAYTYYSGNYLNWMTTVGAGTKMRIDIVREAVSRLISNTTGVKVGLMRYGYSGAIVFDKNTATECLANQNPDESTRSGNGAPVVFPVTDLDGPAVAGFRGGPTVRGQLRYALGTTAADVNQGWNVNPSVAVASQPYQVVTGSKCPIPLMVPGGRSPIGGAMHEAYLYFSGNEVSPKYGTATLGSTYDYPSVDQARLADGDTYKTPIVDSCAKNYIVLLSDGTTEQDNDIDAEIRGLPDFAAKTGSASCDNDAYLTDVPPPSMCVDDAAEYLFETDLIDDAIVPGFNNVVTHTVGFALGADVKSNAARQLLLETAKRGGGSFFEALNVTQLEEALTKVIRMILTENTSFSAPAVTVNAFNRTQNLNDLYMSVFRPSEDQRWLGNIKKYVIDPNDGDILDAAGTPAVDPATGYFQVGTRSLWSAVADGSDITLGGAASKINPDTRTVLTNASGTTLVNLSAAGYTDANFGVVAGDYLDWGTASSGALTNAHMVSWVYGRDVADSDADGNATESRYDMGDPLHSKPVTMVYGGTVASPSLTDAALFVSTNDGMVHAINPETGAELWSFLPRDMVGRIRDQFYSRTAANIVTDRTYGMDGHLTLTHVDVNNNGIIEPLGGDKVYLYVGQQRGGSMYYGLNVTNKASPTLMWEQSYASVGAGQSWSALTSAKVLIGGTVKKVLIFGGGYDTRQDAQTYVEDVVGRGIYMIDALTGALLWRAGPDAGANLRLTEMRHSIPGDVRVIDISGDGFADRMYASDTGGRVWRFDIFNGNTVAGAEGSRLVEGGLFASLGNVEDSAPRDESNTLRFFYSPDPSLITLGGMPYINLAIGSGHRERPMLDSSTYTVTPVRNWLFSIRDYNVLSSILSSNYKASCAAVTAPCHALIKEGDLEDLTSKVGAAATAAVPVQLGENGWKIELEGDGEKVLSEARTFRNSIYVTTYAPTEKGRTPDNCGVVFGVNKVYVVNALDATPTENFNKANPVGEVDDRSKELNQSSIAPEVVFIFPTPEVDPSDPTKELPAVSPVCLVGLEGCGSGMTNPPVRTYWRKKGVR